jgi:hypothetical protein
MTINASIDYRRCAFAHSASLMMESYCDLYISPEKMSIIIGKQMDDEVSVHLYDPNDDYMDTCVREEVADIVAMHYLGHPWPRYCDDYDVDLFMRNLTAAIEGTLK